jgi:hypothetical protein
MKSGSGSFKNVIPPVEVYSATGNPYKTSLSNLQKNTEAQNELNNKHGGSKRMNKSRKRNGERKSIGGKPNSADSVRPTQIIIPQAPTSGTMALGPNTGNSVSASLSQTLMNHHVSSQYDNEVVVPPIKKGGSLLKRLEKMATRKKRTKKTKGGKTRNNKKKK